MKIFAIYVIIGIIEYLLVAVRVATLVVKEEGENGAQFTPASNSILEKGLALMKLAILFMIPVLRTAITVIILFSKQMQTTIIESMHGKNENFNKENA